MNKYHEKLNFEENKEDVSSRFSLFSNSSNCENAKFEENRKKENIIKNLFFT
jgi:hypothetical protein